MDSRNIPLNRSRGYSHFNNIVRVSDRWRAASSIEWESDSEIMRDFKRDDFYRNQWNQSHNEISYEGEGYSISILSRWQVNNHESLVEQLPLFNLEAGPNQWGQLKLFHSISLNYANLIKRDNWGRNDHSIHRINLGYKVEKPLPLYTGLTLTPSLAWMHQDYQTQNGPAVRTFNEYGLDLHALMHQRIPYSNDIWEIDQILHLVKLSVGFRETSMVSGNSVLNLPEIYPTVDDLNLAPFDLLDHQNRELVSEKTIIRFGCENIIAAKWDNRTRKLISMRTYYDLLDNHPQKVNEGDFLYSDIRINPIYWLSLNFRNKIDLDSGKNFRKSYSLSLRDGRFQGASLSYVSYLDFNNYSYFQGWKRINEKLFGSSSFLYDLDHKFLTYWNGKFEYRTNSSWVWDFSVTQRKGTRKENNIEWSVGLSLGGFKLNQLTQPDGLGSIYSM